MGGATRQPTDGRPDETCRPLAASASASESGIPAIVATVTVTSAGATSAAARASAPLTDRARKLPDNATIRVSRPSFTERLS